MDDRDGPVGTVDGPQQRQSDGVVAAQRDDARKGFAPLCGTEFLGIRLRLTREDAVVSFFDLVKRVRVVVPGRPASDPVQGADNGVCHTRSPGYHHSPGPLPSC